MRLILGRIQLKVRIKDARSASWNMALPKAASGALSALAALISCIDFCAKEEDP